MKNILQIELKKREDEANGFKQAVCFVHSVNDTDMHRHMQMHDLMSFCEYFYIKCKKYNRCGTIGVLYYLLLVLWYLLYHTRTFTYIFTHTLTYKEFRCKSL